QPRARADGGRGRELGVPGGRDAAPCDRTLVGSDRRRRDLGVPGDRGTARAPRLGPLMTAARTPSWHALPDAVDLAGQWRPADLRGLPATLRYGASLSGVALAAARGRPRKVLLVDRAGPVYGADLEAAIDGAA